MIPSHRQASLQRNSSGQLKGGHRLDTWVRLVRSRRTQNMNWRTGDLLAEDEGE